MVEKYLTDKPVKKYLSEEKSCLNVENQYAKKNVAMEIDSTEAGKDNDSGDDDDYEDDDDFDDDGDGDLNKDTSGNEEILNINRELEKYEENINKLKRKI